MFVGIICACTPAAAKSCNHHLHNLSSLKKQIDSRLVKSSNRTRDVAFRSPLKHRGVKRPPGLYSTIDSTTDDVYQGSATLDSDHSNAVHPLIRSEHQHPLESGGIHLTFELQNSTSRVDHGEGQPYPHS